MRSRPFGERGLHEAEANRLCILQSRHSGPRRQISGRMGVQGSGSATGGHVPADGACGVLCPVGAAIACCRSVAVSYPREGKTRAAVSPGFKISTRAQFKMTQSSPEPRWIGSIIF